MTARDCGKLAEFSLKLAILSVPPSAWGRDRDGAGEFMGRELAGAAQVVNPAMAQLCRSLRAEHGVTIKFVQFTLCEKNNKENWLSIDVVARRGGDTWWLEIK